MAKNDWQLILSAFKTSIPVLMGYIPLGVVFGFLFVQAGGSWQMATLSSILIYGGAVQYMMIPMLAADMSVASIAVATAIVNLRHVFYGLSLLERYQQAGWKKWLMAFLLTDETYSLVCSEPKDTPIKKCVYLSLFNWSWWILGSFIGAVIGENAKIDLAGMDFVLTSLFAMLLCEQWRSRSTSAPVWIAVVSYAAARLISVDNALALAIAFSAIAALAIAFTKKKKNNEQVLNG